MDVWSWPRSLCSKLRAVVLRVFVGNAVQPVINHPPREDGRRGSKKRKSYQGLYGIDQSSDSPWGRLLDHADAYPEFYMDPDRKECRQFISEFVLDHTSFSLLCEDVQTENWFGLKNTGGGGQKLMFG